MNDIITVKRPSFAAKMREVFGMNQTLSEFTADLKKLLPDDRRYYSNALLREGHDHVPYCDAALPAIAAAV